MTTEEIKRPDAKTIERRTRKAIDRKAHTLDTLTIEYVGIEEISPNEYNPNRQSDHDFELLCRSIEEDGFTQPVIALRETRKIVDGEHRWRAAAVLGMRQIPVVFVDMTPEQAKISTLRHNRARGSEDIDLAANVLSDLRQLGALDWAMDSLMMDQVEVDALLADLPAPDALAGETYTDAWAPDVLDRGATNEVGARTESMTPAAVEEVRRQEQRIKEARTEEERQIARKDANTYRLSLVFAGDEATIIRRVLGDEPAATLLTLCKQRLISLERAEEERQ